MCQLTNFVHLITDTLLVTETGYELLTGRNDEPVMTWNEDLISR